MHNMSYLKQIIDSAAKTIKESVFKEQYLPLLFHPDPALFNMRWINEVAKTPHSPVQVIDNDNKVLFIVPPLRESNLTDNSPNLQNELSHANKVKDINGVLANNFLLGALSRVIHEPNVISEESKNVWRSILVRYKLEDTILTKAIDGPLVIKDSEYEDEDW